MHIYMHMYVGMLLQLLGSVLVVRALDSVNWNDDILCLCPAFVSCSFLCHLETKKGSIAIQPKKGHHKGIGRAM